MYKPNKFSPDPKKSAEKRVKASVKRVHEAYDIKKLVKELDKVFSLYIRLRNVDQNGMVKCFTSGKIMWPEQSQCGHFISRRHYATRWDEINCQVQSVAENMFNQGNGPVFGQKLNEKYGAGTVDGLLLKKNNKFKLDFFTLKYLIEEYKLKLKNLNR